MSQQPIHGAQDVFLPVGGGIAANIPSRGDHPIPRTGIVNPNYPLATNKFYGNFYLGDQSNPTWTHPYSVAWSKGGGNAKSYGLAVSHTGADSKVVEEPHPEIPGSPCRYFFSPVGIQSVILSASELAGGTVLTTDTLKAFSVNVNLQPQSNSLQRIMFPLLQGMGFVTGVYSNLQPAIQTGVFFRSFNIAGSPKPGVFKYQIQLEDGLFWLLYATPSNGANPNLESVSNSLVRGSPGFSGTIQVAKNRFGASGEQMYDAAAGAYATDARVTGSVTGRNGQYTLTFSKSGRGDSTLLMFALPHHVQSFDDETKRHLTNNSLVTTTKGFATAINAEYWTMIEPNLPVDMGFAPFAPGTVSTLSDSAKVSVRGAATSEAAQNFSDQVYAGGAGMYFGGKRIHKFARIVYTMQDLLQDPGAADALTRLKNLYAEAVNNTKPNNARLVYDTAWKGVVSEAGYGDIGAEFGNTVYNDHHFHYGYWIHAAAIIGHLDPGWLTLQNKDWVNTLVKDACNPLGDGQFFPFSRAFDWFHGHSWAHGVTPVGDGKDQESTSEDANFAYSIKMWGKVTGDTSMEARGNLMLSIQARSFQNYFLMDSSNVNQPSKFIANKVTGILFENKCDHATFFDGNFYAIQGIHMIPLLPCSPLIRTKKFVQEEWNSYFRDGGAQPASGVNNGWKSILYQNLALIDPQASWNLFAQSGFNSAWLDDGASLTWALAFAAGLGGH